MTLIDWLVYGVTTAIMQYLILDMFAVAENASFKDKKVQQS